MEKPTFDYDPLSDYIHDAILDHGCPYGEPTPMPYGVRAVVVGARGHDVVHRYTRPIVRVESPTWPEPYEMTIDRRALPLGMEFVGTRADWFSDHFEDVVMTPDGDYWRTNEDGWYGPDSAFQDDPPAGEKMSFVQFLIKTGVYALPNS